MNLEFECTYCGKKWFAEPASQYELSQARCIKCGDAKLKVKDAKNNKVDYYQGCPPFPAKKKNWSDY